MPLLLLRGAEKSEQDILISENEREKKEGRKERKKEWAEDVKTKSICPKIHGWAATKNDDDEGGMRGIDANQGAL
jgi:hypothetical protein